MADEERSPVLAAAVGFVAAWGGHDPGAFASVCDPGVHYEDPLTSAPLRGPAELGEHAVRLWDAFPDVTIETAGEVSSGGWAVAVPCRAQGTHRAALAGLPATGRSVRVHGIFWAEPAGDGRLVRVRAFFDLYDAGVQLGILPSRGGLGEKALLALRGFGVRARG